MVRILATSIVALCLTATAAAAQDAHDAFADLCLANRDTDQVREAVVADGWTETSEEIGQQARSLLNMTTEVWTKRSRDQARSPRFIAFGRIPGAEYGSTLPADVCFVVSPGTSATQAATHMQRAVNLAPNGGAGVWVVSHNGRGFQAEPDLVTATPDVMAEAAATRDVRMLAAIPGNGLAIYLQMIAVAGRN